MSFKRGFLNRPDAFSNDHSKRKGTTNNDSAVITEVKRPAGTPKDPSIKLQKLYEMPRNFSTIPAKGSNAPPQSFRGPMNDPLKEYLKDPLNERVDLFQIRGLGHHILLNLDLGPNAKNGESGREKIPTWINADQIDFLNNLVGPPPSCGVEEADRIGKMWGKIEAGPDLGGPRRDGEGVLWEMKEIPGKGRGLFALRDFVDGDLIISERPIQIMPKVFPKIRELSRAEWFTSLHERRDEAQKKRFESLCNSKKTEILGHNTMDLTKADSNCEGISRTNQIRFGFMSDETHLYTAVYGAISRLNHSCGPNTNWEWYDKSFSLQLRACRSIKAGEELTVEYCSTLKPKAARQTLLEELYQFVCGCPWCSLTGDESIQSDINRNELKSWFEKRVTFIIWRGSPSITRKALIDENESQIAIIKAEGLDATLLLIHTDLHLAYIAYADKAKAEKYGRLVIERFEKLSPSMLRQKGTNMDEMKKMTEKPEESWLWGYGLNRDKNPASLKDYGQSMSWSLPDFFRDGPLRQAFASMSTSQQSEVMESLVECADVEIKDFGGMMFGVFPSGEFPK